MKRALFALLALLMRISDSAARRNHEVPDSLTPGERLARRRLRRGLAKADRKAGATSADAVKTIGSTL